MTPPVITSGCQFRTGGRGERGQVAGIEVLPFGLLIFVAGALLVSNLWGVVDAKYATDAASREAARWVVERAGAGVDLQAGAQQVAEQTLADHGRTGPSTVEVLAPAAAVARCDRVTVRVTVHVPAIRIPFLGGFGEAFEVAASHSELVDPTRSDVPGEAVCIR